MKKAIKQELAEKGISAGSYYALRRERDGSITGMLTSEPGRYSPRTNTGGRRLVCN